MQTHDEETRRFFKHSTVQVLLCPRAAGKGHSWAKKQVGYISLVAHWLFPFLTIQNEMETIPIIE